MLDQTPNGGTLGRWGHQMRQQQLKLTFDGPGTRTTRVVYRRYQPQAAWWFRQIRENLNAESEPTQPEPNPAAQQEMFHWR